MLGMPSELPTPWVLCGLNLGSFISQRSEIYERHVPHPQRHRVRSGVATSALASGHIPHEWTRFSTVQHVGAHVSNSEEDLAGSPDTDSETAADRTELRHGRLWSLASPPDNPGEDRLVWDYALD